MTNPIENNENELNLNFDFNELEKNEEKIVSKIPDSSKLSNNWNQQNTNTRESVPNYSQGFLSEIEEIEQKENNELKKRMNETQLLILNKSYFIRIFYISIVLIVVSILLSWTYLYNKFIEINWKEWTLTSQEEEYLTQFNDSISLINENISSILLLFWYDNNLWSDIDTQSINLENIDVWSLSNVVNEYIDNKTITYLNKKESLKNEFTKIFTKISQNKENINKIKNDILKFAYLSKEIDDILDWNQIMNALISVESIKLFTALKILSYNSSFINELSNSIWIQKDKLVLRMNKYIEKWEWFVQAYIKYCYLNPIESQDCSLIDDFSNFLIVTLKTKEEFKEFDKQKFIYILGTVFEKLESPISPIKIVLNRLDPKNNKLSFSIDINTFKDDVFDIVQNENILDNTSTLPHVYIIQQLTNMLRESHYIIWEDIKLDKLELENNKIKVWDLEFLAITSKFKFDIPIQKSIEREIFDFIYK